jgi:hypothetical protein
MGQESIVVRAIFSEQTYCSSVQCDISADVILFFPLTKLCPNLCTCPALFMQQHLTRNVPVQVGQQLLAIIIASRRGLLF